MPSRLSATPPPPSHGVKRLHPFNEPSDQARPVTTVATSTTHPSKPTSSSANPTSPTQASPESLKTAFKKRGHFDTMRKSILGTFTESEFKTTFVNSMTTLVEAEIAKDTALLTRDRTKAGMLIEGAIERTDIYRDVEERVDRLLEERRKELEDMVRMVSDEALGKKKEAEEKKQSQTDDAAERKAEKSERRDEGGTSRSNQRDEKGKEVKRDKDGDIAMMNGFLD